MRGVAGAGNSSLTNMTPSLIGDRLIDVRVGGWGGRPGYRWAVIRTWGLGADCRAILLN